jgi:hypothetical protein
MTPEQITDLAVAHRVPPREVELAIALIRSGRADLLSAVMDGRMTVRAALAAAREGKKG